MPAYFFLNNVDDVTK